MSEAVLNFFICNNEVFDTLEFDNVYVEEHPSVYEVIRLINGVPLFLEEHHERLIRSAALLGYNLNITLEEIRRNIERIVEKNNVQNYNVKLVVNNLEKTKKDVYYFFIESNYPDEDMYLKGVSVFLYNGERVNPNAKVIQKHLRNKINEQLKKEKCYEALLVNSDGEITEGSRSNLFFIKDDIVCTAPSEDVLIGITRQRIIRLCGLNGIKVTESKIKVAELDSFESAFISGTSPKVLPISNIGDMKLSTNNPLLRKIMEIYDDEINSYIKLHKKNV